MYRTAILLSALSVSPCLIAQDNAILIYDVLTQEVETIPAVGVPEPVSHFMPGNAGTFPGMVSLPDVIAPPGFIGTALMRPPYAVDTYTLTDYPVRAAGGLREVSDATTRHRCSAQLVAPRFALTAAHCVRTFSDVWIPGSLEFMPVFDQGMPSGVPSSQVVRYYVPEQNIRDFALLELAEPIGHEVGWLGLGFNDAPDYFDGRIVHKFIYPGDTSFADPSLIYNGDTLYTLSTPMERSFVGSTAYVGVTGWNSIPGESGSGVWVADGDSYHVLGVASFSSNYRHTLLDPGTYYQFRTIIESDVVGVNEATVAQPGVRIYPNPMSTRATLAITGASADVHELRILDLGGRTVRSIPFTGASCTLDRADLAAGTYVISASGRDGVNVMGKLVVE